MRLQLAHFVQVVRRTSVGSAATSQQRAVDTFVQRPFECVTRGKINSTDVLEYSRVWQFDGFTMGVDVDVDICIGYGTKQMTRAFPAFGI